MAQIIVPYPHIVSLGTGRRLAVAQCREARLQHQDHVRDHPAVEDQLAVVANDGLSQMKVGGTTDWKFRFHGVSNREVWHALSLAEVSQDRAGRILNKEDVNKPRYFSAVASR